MATEAQPATEAQSGPVQQPLAWSPCGGRRECATLAAPLDHAAPELGTIDLAVARIPASGAEDAHLGPLLINPGGPGASGIALLDRLASGPEVWSRFDVIAWDPRGVEASQGVDCQGAMTTLRSVDSGPDDAEEQAALDEAAAAVARRCAELNGDVLAHIGSDSTVRDMELIRQAVGADQISYLGFSYGTALGLRYLDLFPSRVRALAIDGVLDPARPFEEWLTAQAVGFEMAMTQVFASCGSACPTGDAAEAYDQLASIVETSPLPAVSGVSLGPTELATAAIFTAYSPSSWPTFIQGIEQALGGDGSTLGTLASRYWQIVDFDSYLAIVCSDGPHPTGGADFERFAADAAAVSPRFGPAIANELSPCAFWPTDPDPLPRPTTGEGGPPVLLVGTTGDAATPYADAVRLADQLSNGRLLTFRGDRHIAYGRSSCVTSAVDQYLLTLALPPDGATC